MSIRKNKNLLFGGLGFLGGAVGALLAEALPDWMTQSAWISIAHVTIWCAICSTGILLGITWALEIYAGRTRPAPRVMKRALISGLIAGAVAGGAAQAVFTVHSFSGLARFFFQSGCWAVAGAILGWRVSRAMANLGLLRGIMAGLIGGFIGGMVFLFVSRHIAEVLGRMVGFGMLGAALGAAMVIVEALFREAYLEVIWAPREITKLSLGTSPVSIGGGEDHIFVRGLPPRTATIVMETGKICYTDNRTGKITALSDGTRITVAQIQMVVHALK